MDYGTARGARRRRGGQGTFGRTGRRSAGRGRAPRRQERIRLLQLLVCLAVFLAVFIGRGVFPGRLLQLRDNLLTLITADTDFQSAFSSLGESAEEDSLLFRAGERIPAHEFHYWDCTENGTDLTAEKPLRPGSWRCGWATPRLYAAFPHLHFGGDLPLAERFAAAAACWEGRI